MSVPTNFITRHWNKGPGEQARDSYLMDLRRLPLHESDLAMADFARRREGRLEQQLGPQFFARRDMLRNMSMGMPGMAPYYGGGLGLSY